MFKKSGNDLMENTVYMQCMGIINIFDVEDFIGIYFHYFLFIFILYR